MDKTSNLFERIMKIIDHYGIKNVNEFAKEYLGYDSSEKINRLKVEGKYPSYEILSDISNKFENIDINWLITGRGTMLKNEDFLLKEKEEIYNTKKDEEINFLRQHVNILTKENITLINLLAEKIENHKN